MPGTTANRATLPERGFVLVGVVMIVLALTILGLSLFALSSYESQFAGRAYDSERALDVAQSGIDHAKFVLARRQKLEDVGSVLFPDGVIYSRARRTDNTGYLVPDTIGAIPADVPVEIRVLARVQGERRMLQANFLPQQGLPIYKRLMTVTDSLRVRDYTHTATDQQAACDHSWFVGEVKHGDDDGSIPCGNYPNGRVVSNDLPQPDVESLFSQRKAGAQVVSLPPLSGPNILIPLHSGAGPEIADFFKTETDPNWEPYSLYIPRKDDGKCTIDVNGWVVWMLPHGFRSLRKVVIEGSGIAGPAGRPHDCLVIVTGSSSDFGTNDVGTPGLWFDNTLEIHDNVPVICVTSGWFGYEHSYADFRSLGETLNYLTVFAHAALIGAGDGDMTLRHLPNDPNDGADALIDKLCKQGALPNSQAGGLKFKSVAGTWIELDPDHPPN